MSSIKKAIQSALLAPRKNKYEKDCLRLMNEYKSQYEKKCDYVLSDEIKAETSKKVLRISADEIKNSSESIFEDEMFYLVYDESQGILKSESERIVFEYVKDDPIAVLCYGDEDYFISGQRETGIGYFRFFKPVFSPETLASFDYINSFAIKGNALKDSMANIEKDFGSLDKEEYFYALTFEACASVTEKYSEKSIRHISAVLTQRELKTDETKKDILLRAGELCRDLFLKESLSMSESRYEKIREKGLELLGLDLSKETPKVSIIIPSKDNPEMLKRCIDSLELKEDDNIEIIVVDNGSSEENRKQIEEYLRGYKYIYEPMEFNYSKMNNIGAKEANGEVLLLLNDDIEAKGHEWIYVMAKKAASEKVGCVGCKLLYPDGLIQHVGIEAGVAGPAHIHMGERDDIKEGYGDNTVNRNVLCVTGAALAVKKELYEKLGGLNEELKVGYNDVDFCMSAYEAGYRNVLLNEIVLTHYESTSRGKDSLDKSKAKRLRNERNILVLKHKELMNVDPYSGGEAEFRLAFEKESEDEKINAKGMLSSRTSNDDEGWIYSSFEKVEVNEKKEFIAKGFSLVPGMDNMRFDFDLILQKDETQFVIPIERNLRTDLSGRFNETTNTELCGINIKADVSTLDAGEYEIKIYAKDHGNVRELVTGTNFYITIR